jgi:diguanylate cyclase (GGDEF)-like protein
VSTAAAPEQAAAPRIAYDELIVRLQRAIAENTDLLAVVVIEAADFPRIFARFGNERGNALLTRLSERLSSALRPSDAMMQVGDHTFIVLVGGLKNSGHAVLAGKKLLRVCEPEMPGPSSQHVRLNVRAGIALYPAHSDEPAKLVQSAQMALEVARDSGKDLVVFDDQRAGTLSVGWDLRDELADAVREGDLEVHYQPKLDLKTDKVCGAEALLRWFSPIRGQVPPPQIIAVAEGNELLAPITRYVLNTALRNAVLWRKDGHDVGVAVNLPASMLLDKGLAEVIRSMLSIWNAPAEMLTLEVTESAIMTDVDASFATMTQLKALGARISIDDFGTGYSSFSYFKSIPADELKIDRAFVAGMTDNQADQHIVETITNLAHRFKLKVVAEGIEDEATLNALRALSCDIGQGYFIARPMPQSQLESWLDSRLY